MTMNVTDELGTGSYDPYALTNQEHLYAGFNVQLSHPQEDPDG